MHKFPFRTGKTWLADDQLVLLDVLFHGDASLRLLRRECFLEQWNLGYTHNLDDAALKCNLRWLLEHGVLERKKDASKIWFTMTANGGELWSQERCPIWERYCTERYKSTLRGKTLMSVRAVSSQIRDNFLAMWPNNPARRRSATVTDCPLIEWRPFDRVYVGVAIYDEPLEWTSEEHARQSSDHELEHWRILDCERSWWRNVPELQRFIANFPVSKQ